MSRRTTSPIRVIPRAEGDPRENMIKKLKDDLIIARGRQKELALLENYLIELIEKIRLLSAETAKSDEEGRIKLELTLKTVNELKKQVDILKNEMRNTNNELGQAEEEESGLKKLLNARLIEIQKMKKQGNYLHNEGEKLISENHRLRAMEDQIQHDIKKIKETIRDYEVRLGQVNRKILEVKGFINQMATENQMLKQNLKNYENQNNGIGSDLEQKENRIDDLQKVFAQKHEMIKMQVENFIDLQHQHERNVKETRHKANLVKIQNQKYNELGSILKKIEKTIGDRDIELNSVLEQCGQIKRVNEDFFNQNNRLKQDLIYCQEHLQNLLKHNAYMQEEMENYIRQDEMIINVIRKKKILPSLDNLRSLRDSRNDYKYSSRTKI